MSDRSIICVLLLTLLIVFPLASAETGMPESPNHQVFLLLVIDFDDFMCPTCMDSVLGFCRSLPVPLQKKQVWGVVVSDRANSEGQEGLSERILEKKIRGFVKANRLEFSILLDRDGVFKPLARQGTVFFIFDTDKQTLSRYIFPLTPLEVRFIQESLATNYRD